VISCFFLDVSYFVNVTYKCSYFRNENYIYTICYKHVISIILVREFGSNGHTQTSTQCNKNIKFRMTGDSDSDDEKPINQFQSSSNSDVELLVFAEQMPVRFLLRIIIWIALRDCLTIWIL
jgi:hypothetical protein